ncbi:biotin-dependent carboxyltransferase family protein [Paraglaciecola sp.]|uniref:5-oxoprolinase subunit C family protein n=1 Tax=Paraglaciecola sp. TaxID=1920173 RepID=UPI003EF7FC43
MSIQCIKPGMQTSLQDIGRVKLMHWGIANTGAMDRLSMVLANKIIANPDNHPVLEICLIGPSLLFSQAMSIAICGAEFKVVLENDKGSHVISNNQNIKISAGDKLIFGKRLQGARAYLAFSGKVNLTKTFNSFSTHFQAQFGGYHGRALNIHDVIDMYDCEVRTEQTIAPLPSSALLTAPQYSGKYILRCTSSVETNLFKQHQINSFYSTKYTVSSASNRMGLRLEGESLESLAIPDITSSGLLTGSIQIPPNGLPIISSVDGQTIGGYPRIANVISADQFTLGQLVAGDQIQFINVNVEQAHKLLKQQRSWLDTLIPHVE